MEYLDEQRNILLKELAELRLPVEILFQKQQRVKTNNELDIIDKEIKDFYTKNDGENLKKEEFIKEKIHQCNIEHMLGHRRDLVNTYLVIDSSLRDSYNLLFSLEENDKRINKIEDLITELENGLNELKDELGKEGVSCKDATDYNNRYRD